MKIGKVGRRGFELPPEVAVETTAVLGVRGSGKTVTGTVIVEELLKLGTQVVVIDPTDVWHGLRSSIDGEEAGFPVVVLGGPHGDLPVEETSGRVLADFVVEHRVPVILSLRHLRKGRQVKLVTEFAEQLYHRKGEAEHRTPLLVTIDEASAFVPQRVTGDKARCVGAIEDLVRRGRAAGLGVCLIDQRPASVNKDVLTQLSTLVCHRIASPQDRKALDEWIKQHDSEGLRDAFLEDLASLPTGEAYFWSPMLDVFDRVQVRMRETFDSSKTPKLGEQPQLPEAIAAVDLDELRGLLEETIAEAEASDPKALRMRIATLEHELADARQDRECECDDLPELVERLQEAEEYSDRIASGRHAAADRLEEVTDDVHRRLESVIGGLDGLRDVAALLRNGDSPPPAAADAPASRPKPARTPAARREKRASAPLRAADPGARDGLPGPQRRILDALATLESIGVDEVSRQNLAVFSRQSPKSSQYQRYVAELEKHLGHVRYPSTGYVQLTDSGRALAEPTFEIHSPADLHQAWLSYLDDYQSSILRVLLDTYPGDVDRDELAELAGKSPRSSLYQKNVATLEQLGAVEYPAAGRVRASELLFPKGL